MHETLIIPVVPTAAILLIAAEADVDTRSVRKELKAPGSVRGRAGERIRIVLARKRASVPA